MAWQAQTSGSKNARGRFSVCAEVGPEADSFPQLWDSLFIPTRYQVLEPIASLCDSQDPHPPLVNVQALVHGDQSFADHPLSRVDPEADEIALPVSLPREFVGADVQ